MFRRELPLFITIAVGWFMIADFFIPKFRPAATELQQWAIIMTACAIVLGVVNVARINLLKVSRRGHDWPYSILLLGGLFFMVLLGAFLPMVRGLMGSDAAWTIGNYRLTGVTEGTLFLQVYNVAYVPLQMTMFSLLAWFIASAAFRAFRIRRLEAGLLAVTALIVMIGRVPVANWIPGLPELQDWIMNVPQLAAKRAILIGAALGAISTGLKVILGVERNFMGSD